LNFTLGKGENSNSAERKDAGKGIYGDQRNLFWPSKSLWAHKSMESFHRKHLHKTVGADIWFPSSAWPGKERSFT